MKSGSKLFVLVLAPLVATGVYAQDLSAPMQGVPTGEPPAHTGCTFAGSSVELAFPCRDGEVKTGILEMPDGSLEMVRYEVVEPGVGVVEGDILVRLDEENEILAAEPDSPRLGAKSTGRSNGAYHWSGATVPYVNSLSYSPSRVTSAIDHWEQNTNLVFVPRTNETDYIEFVPSTGCSSYVGRQGGRQAVNLANGCSTGNTIHEIGHAIGLWHEQNRSDRDEAVDIHWGNIQNGLEYNFETYVQRGEDGFDRGGHDFGSIMHYGSYAFSANGYPTITKKDGSTFVAQRNGLSSGDRYGVDYMYGLRIQATYWCTEIYRECHFTANVLQGATPIQSYEWFFDDTPETKFGRSVDHTFSTYGSHYVEVLVQDAGGDQAIDTIDLYLDQGDPCVICQ